VDADKLTSGAHTTGSKASDPIVPGTRPKFYSYYTKLGALNMKGAARMQARGLNGQARGYSGGGR